MRKIILPLAAVLTALFASGCAGPDQKLGRGLSNTYEIVRLGELRKSIEENAMIDRPGYGYYGGPAYVAATPGCYWQRQRFWDGYGWRIRRVQVCG